MSDSIDVLPNNYYVNTLTHKSTEGKVWFEPSVITLLGPEGVTNNTKIHIAAMQYLYLVEFWEIHTIFINHILGQISATLKINMYIPFVLLFKLNSAQWARQLNCTLKKYNKEVRSNVILSYSKLNPSSWNSREEYWRPIKVSKLHFPNIKCG